MVRHRATVRLNEIRLFNELESFKNIVFGLDDLNTDDIIISPSEMYP